MKKLSTNQKKILWRAVAFVCSVFSIISVLIAYYLTKNTRYPLTITFIIISFCLLTSCLIYQLIYPLDIRLYISTTIAFSYFVEIFGCPALGVLLLYSGIILAIKSGYMKNNKIIIIVLLSTSLLISFITTIRFGKIFFIKSIIEFISSILALTILNLVFLTSMDSFYDEDSLLTSNEPVLSIFNDLNFSEKDKAYLIGVLNGEKYEQIALDNKVSVSTVKKRLHTLYRKLGVTNQIDFLIIYGKHK